MKPMPARIVVVLFAAGLAAGVLRADDARPAPTPAKRGGYGASPHGSPQPSATAAAPVPAAAAGWMAAAEARLAAAVDEVNQRSAAADRTWAGVADKIDAHVRELMTRAGYSGSEMESCYSPQKWPQSYVERYRGFYSSAAVILARANLRRVGNPPVYSFRQEPISKDGNRAAVDAAMAALDEGMAVFRYYDGVMQKQLATYFETEAQRRFLSAEQSRTEEQVAEAKKEGDPGPYDDSANTAARAKLRALWGRRDRLGSRGYSAIDPKLALWDIDIIIHLPVFAGFERLATQQDNPIAMRTGKIVPLAEVARRMEEHIQDLGTRSNQIYTLPAFEQWTIDSLLFLGFYRRQVDAIGTSLRRWFKRGGATEADLGRIDSQMKASEKADPEFNATIRQLANYQQQITALSYRTADLRGEIDELNMQAIKLRGSGDYPGASALDAQAEPLGRQERQLDKTHDQIYGQNNQYVQKTDTEVAALNFVEPTPSGHVTAVLFELVTEAEPDKSVVPQYPLKGAPVSLSLTRQVTDITLGIPFVVRVDWEQEEGTAPAEQVLSLVIGGKSVPLTMHLNSTRSGYESDRVIFMEPPASPAGPLVQP